MTEKIYPGSDGLFAIFFANVKSRTDEEILQDFSKYGEIISLRKAAGAKACFVRYALYEEAKNCLQDMKYSVDYARVQMAKNKADMQNFDNDPNKWKRNPQDARGQNEIQPPKQSQIKTNRKWSLHEGVVSRPSSRSCGPPRLDDSWDESVVSGGPLSLENIRGAVAIPRGQFYRHNRDGDGGPPQLEDARYCDGGPPQLEDARYGNSDSDGPPPLEDTKAKKPDIYAQEIILINIPDQARPRDIYMLCHNLDPIHISTIKRTGMKRNLRYCHVYLSQYQTDAAEQLHGKYLYGEKLLCSRVEKLMACMFEHE